MFKGKSGVTLISLVVTIIVLIILASISVYSGLASIKSSRYTRFQNELEIMQAQVNLLYEKYQEQILNGTEITEVGKDISIADANKVSTAFSGAGETDSSGYRYFDKETIRNLEIDGINGEFLVNIATRNVISLDGYEYEGIKYYTLQQINGESAEIGGLDRGNITVGSVTYEEMEKGYKIKIENVQCSKYSGWYSIKYREEKMGMYLTLEKRETNANYEFEVKSEGTYHILITDSAGKTYETTIEI